jgi:hypothetical protein
VVNHTLGVPNNNRHWLEHEIDLLHVENHPLWTDNQQHATVVSTAKEVQHRSETCAKRWCNLYRGMRKKKEIWMKRASRAGCRDERKTVQRKVLNEA